MSRRKKLMRMYQLMHQHYGDLHWWPGETAFEVIVGAILTQNTAWGNVERAICNLKEAKVLSPQKMLALPPKRLAKLIQPSGFFNVKEKRLRNFLNFLKDRYGLDLKRMFQTPIKKLREELLHVRGIGEETADSILLYAGNKKTFVVDTYTKRVLTRHGMIQKTATYHDIQRLFEKNLPKKVSLYNDFHAQIVNIGKDFCKPRARCEGCPLRDWEKITLEH